MKKIHYFIRWAVILNTFMFMTMPVFAAVTTSESDNSNQLKEVESLVGHYQFNIAAGSNINASYMETDGMREYSHVPEMEKYEKNHSKELIGNSSGCLLDGSFNEGGDIYKAYLVIETSTSDLSLPDYPITLVSENGDKLESKVQKYCFDTTYSSGNDRRCGYMDVTEFVKKNGYGMYYVCNIPFTKEDQQNENDEFAGWKLIVIEENESIPVRILKLKLGCENIVGEGQSAVISVNKDGIRTARTKEVTGQFLYGMSGADRSKTEKQYNSISYACGNGNLKDTDFIEIEETSGARTVKNPLSDICTRNGLPIESVSVFQHPLYIKNGEVSSEKEEGSIQSGSGDIELLDINEESGKYHNVSVGKNLSTVSFRFESTAGVALMSSVMGIAVDIDVPEYEHEFHMTQEEEAEKFVIEGTFKNSTELFDIGLKDPYFVMEYDNDLKANSIEARLTSLGETDAGKKEKVIQMNDIIIDEANHLIKIPMGSIDYSGNVNIKNDTLFYKITFRPSKWKDAYGSRVYAEGTLFSDGKDTKMFIPDVAKETISASQDEVETKVSINGEITWDDDDNRYGKRPKELTVYLTNDSVAIKPQKVKGEKWSFQYDDEPVYRDVNTKIIYGVTLDEDDKLGQYKESYEPHIEKTGENSYSVVMEYTGEREPEKIDMQAIVDYVRSHMGIQNLRSK